MGRSGRRGECGGVAALLGAAPEDSTLKVDASKVVNRITPWMYGSCIEDVNHEVYGGLYAQMIFGESFEEPPRLPPALGWAEYGGRWGIRDGTLAVEPDFGAKIVHDSASISDGSRRPASNSSNSAGSSPAGRPSGR